jgi:RNase H-fold protein (predicted Holliday junction resolvase)
MKKEIISTFKNDVDQVKQSLATLGDKIRSMEESFGAVNSEIRRIDHEMEAMKREISSEAKQRSNLLDNTLREIYQIESRKKNVIICGLPAKENGSIEERNEHDRNICKEILEQLDLTSVEIQKLQRIGQSRNDGNRLLKVELSKSSDRQEIIRRSKSLRGTRFNEIFINPDLTPLQQDKMKKLREELKRRRQQGEEVVIFRDRVVCRSTIKNFQ